MVEKVFVIDLGSNSVRLSVYDVYSDGYYKEIGKYKEMVRLSEGMGDEKVLKPESMKRTINALEKFKTIIDEFGEGMKIFTATAAVRNSKNKDKFLEKVKEEVGFDFRVLTGEEEAYYDFLGNAHDFEISDFLLIDIGGASTELVLVKDENPIKMISLPFGAVVLTEKFLEKDIVSSSSFFNMSSFVMDELKSVEWLNEAKNLPIIAIGGTSRAIAKSNKGIRGEKDKPIHGYSLVREDLFALFSKILSFDYNGRKALPGIDSERADIIIGGMSPLVFVAKIIESDRIITSENGLRDGIIKEYVKNNF